jgi:hypothetical protein
MRQHCPETLQCFGWNAWTKLRDIAFEISFNKIRTAIRDYFDLNRITSFQENRLSPKVYFSALRLSFVYSD